MRAGKGNSGGRLPIDPGALLHGWVVVGITLLAGAAVLTTAGLVTEWEPVGGLLRSLTFLSVTLGGFAAGRKCKCKAWLNGVLTALGLFIVCSWAVNGASASGSWLAWLRTLLLMGFLGMVGGIIGGLNKSRS